jgi:hypothetical protein
MNVEIFAMCFVKLLPREAKIREFIFELSK